jgi:hypothetical protein
MHIRLKYTLGMLKNKSNLGFSRVFHVQIWPKLIIVKTILFSLAKNKNVQNSSFQKIMPFTSLTQILRKIGD